MSTRRMNGASRLLWAAFFAFVAVATASCWSPQLVDFSGASGAVRLVLTLGWLAFIAYSIQCSRNENIVQTIRTMGASYWGRQIGIDLYISVLLSIGLVFLITGSIWRTALWALAFLPFANLAILLFVLLHLDRIIALSASL